MPARTGKPTLAAVPGPEHGRPRLAAAPKPGRRAGATILTLPREPKGKLRARTEPRPRVLVISGPNLDKLGRRQPELYGRTTLEEVHDRLRVAAAREGASVEARQSAHEGDLVTWIGAARGEGFDGIVLNAGAYTHTSIAILDALLGAELPAVEVHVTHPETREAFRRRSLLARGCVGKVTGFGAESYVLGLLGIIALLRSRGASTIA
jgi:3-dehydroquinate dehydratase-2